MNPISLILPAVVAASAHGASLLTLSNPVTDGTINTTASNNIRTDWAGLTAYPADPDESQTPDFNTLTIAHDSTYFHLHEVMHSSVGGFYSGNQIFVFDTDRNRGTGYLGGGGTFAIGGDYLLSGNTLLQYAGSGTDWAWLGLGTISYDDFPTNDHEMSLTRASLGNPAAFDFIALNDYWGGGDVYPNGGHGGAAGAFYTYTTVPEPGTALLGCLGVFARRRRRS